MVQRMSYATAHVFVSVYVAVSNESLRANLEEERLLFSYFRRVILPKLTLHQRLLANPVRFLREYP